MLCRERESESKEKENRELEKFIPRNGNSLKLLNHESYYVLLSCSRMKPAAWYISMLIVAFLYIYLTAIQYIRGEELPVPQTARQSLHGK